MRGLTVTDNRFYLWPSDEGSTPFTKGVKGGSAALSGEPEVRGNPQEECRDLEYVENRRLDTAGAHQARGPQRGRDQRLGLPGRTRGETFKTIVGYSVCADVDLSLI